jgi:hypothetical protein
MSKDDSANHEERLETLRMEHRDLDEVITKMIKEGDFDDLQLQRMKKRKLHLKDQIAILETKLTASA